MLSRLRRDLRLGPKAGGGRLPRLTGSGRAFLLAATGAAAAGCAVALWTHFSPEGFAAGVLLALFSVAMFALALYGLLTAEPLSLARRIVSATIASLLLGLAFTAALETVLPGPPLAHGNFQQPGRVLLGGWC